ncbi:single-stranded-DNA-specific exonuclease RecJ [Algihabitans albus]|uniref:single-stranded-DNA-specific exonuclease RecJ n=1 Tax=Algihabitans albus TaxID=2164067 RepID=UPI000E5C836B|nr:single-stranded-DNA-specific exonuclease RecJ [Algihabitans albus]
MAPDSGLVASTSGPGRACLLGVSDSLSGKRWEQRGGDARLALTLAQRLDLPEIVARVLANRDIDLEYAGLYLEPSLRDQLTDPSRLADMDKAAARLAVAVQKGETIGVFGDYDVDGATSSALLQRFFAALGIRTRIYIPDRLSEGYGPNAPALLRLKAEGVGVCVTVDCGTTAHAALTQAADAGLDIVVCDHHVAEPALPPAYAVVNPNRLDDVSGLGQLAAVGVTFLLAVAVNRTLREAGWYAERPEPRLLDLLDLVALGTVCDVVPLTGLNRAFVAQGLKVLRQRDNPGLAALAEVARMDGPPGTYHAGFLLGPRLNAGGRVGRADLGARLLTCAQPSEAAALAAELDGFNRQRQEIERQVLDQAIEQVERSPRRDGLTLAAGHGWHPGVIGIVAGRLKERYDRPALVIALDDAGFGKGSARSVPKVDLGAAVIAARQEGLVIDGGGHAMAAGLTVAEAQVGALSDFLNERLARRMAETGWRPALGCDGVLAAGAANADLLAQLERCAPFGQGNPEPRFALSAVRAVDARPVGESHLRLRLQGAEGGSLKAICFRAFESDLGSALVQTRGRPLHFAGKLRADTWTGPDAVQFVVDDAAFA